MDKDVIIFLTRIDSYSGCEFVFSVHNASAFTIILGFTEFLIYHDDILPNSASVLGTHYTAKKARQHVHTHSIHLSYHVLFHHSAVTGLIELCNGLLWHQLSGNALGVRVLSYKMWYMVRISDQFMVISPIDRKHRSRDKEVEMGVALFIVICSPHTKFVLFVPATLESLI